MISIERKEIKQLPILEMVDYKLKEEKCPLVVFFHGITGQKEKSLEAGYELAQKGFRVILPDAFLHGERKNEHYDGPKEMEFWSIVWHNVEELPIIVDYYETHNLIYDGKISVAGLSMGGITTCIALAKYPWIYSAASLMGNPDPIGFTKWLVTSSWVEGMPDIKTADIESTMAAFKPFSLQEHPEKIAGRPFYIWHGKEDNSVPFSQTEAFVSMIENKPFASQMEYDYYEGHGHKVPNDVFGKTAQFLALQ